MKHIWCSPQENKMSFYRTNDIEVLLEQLGSLKITNKVSEGINKQTNEEMHQHRQMIMYRLQCQRAWF